MQGFLKIVSTLAIIGIVIIALMFVLDIVTTAEVKETLTKVLLVLVVLALGGVSVSFLTGIKE
ncbi:MAG: hypothetical protein UW27_C0002G0112 [Parcubacteria group bacterium GW2011_GWA1_44_13]|nr:MAG: hypothetical protein UW17_C0013G0003 [Candidatus Nomurabacteria bacterium GW2011_GWD1_44_10]KKT38462.1 MAG: hypothetical protein UW27_C0002G0112 [Parcubacteria group bacterium GW2011_GWA1_44_13]